MISGFDLVLRYQFRVDIAHETIGLCMLSCNRIKHLQREQNWALRTILSSLAVGIEDSEDIFL